jgi:hypothetical protein
MKALRLGACVIIVTLNISCGIDSYTYLDPVTNITSTLNSKAVIRLPNATDVITIDFSPGLNPTMTVSEPSRTLNSDYSIYYRIYLSDSMQQTVNTDAIRNTVNPTLASDWTAFEPYTIDSNNLSGQVATLFSNRKYYPIEVNSAGQLIRSTNNGAFAPKPDDRFFINSTELTDRENMTATVNADVADKSGAIGRLYTYVSMYIVMTTFDVNNLTPIFSSPAFINVFLLPDPFTSVPATNISISGGASASPTLLLSALITPANATDKTVLWSVDSPSSASITPTGNGDAVVASKVSAGSVTVTAKTSNGLIATKDISLSGIAVQSITLPTDLPLTVGGTATLTATFTPSSYSSGSWSSSDESIATVSPGFGNTVTVTAKAVGAAGITVVADDGSLVSASCTVTVTN